MYVYGITVRTWGGNEWNFWAGTHKDIMCMREQILVEYKDNIHEHSTHCVEFPNTKSDLIELLYSVS